MLLEMDAGKQAALRAIEEARHSVAPAGPVKLSKRFLDLVQRMEDLPSNREGTDKSHVEECDRRYREFYRSVRRIH